MIPIKSSNIIAIIIFIIVIILSLIFYDWKLILIIYLAIGGYNISHGK
jgi:hypothetical protein